MDDLLERLNRALADRYRIERELGQGGMATVYLAEDLRHHRRVALKVLRPEIAATLGAGRFAREIEVAARLQHPNILPLLDSGETDGFFFYVMPYVEGESVRDRLARSGEFAIPDAVRIMIEVADALSHAHAHGVVHRDIKPDNILLSGRHALVADFGVAKAVTQATGYQALTSAGIALGTPAYMAPEQAVADPHQDHRVDIYALGVLGYELLTGRPPFEATTAQEMLAAHVTTDPAPLEQHRPTVSPALAQVVRTCLAKKPADRWQTAEDVLQRLEPLATPSGGTTPTQTRPGIQARSWSGRSLLIGLGSVAALAFAGFLGWRWLWPREPLWTLANIRQVTREPEIEFMPAISPDGREVAYERGYASRMHVYVRDAAGGLALPLTEKRAGTQEYPVWSPDGRRIVFMQYTVGEPAGAFAVPRMGGAATPVARAGLSFLWALRGDRVLYQRGDSLFVGTVDGASESFVTAAAGLHSAAWSLDGSRIAFAEGNDEYIGNTTIGNWAPSFSPDGREIAFYSTRFGTRDLFLINADGTGELRLTSDSGEEYHPKFSPDGLQIVYSLEWRGHSDLYAVHRDSMGGAWSAPVQLTRGGSGFLGMWSPDGRQLVYSSAEGIRVLTLGGADRLLVDLVKEGRTRRGYPRWAPDGRSIWFGAASTDRAGGIYDVPATGGRERMVVRFDDPARVLATYGIAVSDGKMYLCLTEFESDIYVADLVRR